MNRGSSRKLQGKILITFLIVTDAQTGWSDDDIRLLKGCHQVSTLRMRAEAKTYGVDLSVELNYIPCTISQKFTRSNYETTSREALLAAGFSSPETVSAELQKKHGVDAAPILMCINREERSFAFIRTDGSFGQEYSVIFGKEDDYRHELYHQFGAQDFYQPSILHTVASHYFPESVMIRTDGRVDPFTAYLLGWQSTVTENVLLLLEACEDMTEKEWTNDYVTDTFTGTRSVTLGFGTYTGEFKNGYICGQGIMEYQNGARYEGEWFNGVRHGEGVYQSADGTVQRGTWRMNRFMG